MPTHEETQSFGMILSKEESVVRTLVWAGDKNPGSSLASRYGFRTLRERLTSQSPYARICTPTKHQLWCEVTDFDLGRVVSSLGRHMNEHLAGDMNALSRDVPSGMEPEEKKPGILLR